VGEHVKKHDFVAWLVWGLRVCGVRELWHGRWCE